MIWFKDVAAAKSNKIMMARVERRVRFVLAIIGVGVLMPDPNPDQDEKAFHLF